MTAETKVYIQAGDIIGLDMTCPHCEVCIAYRLDKIDRIASTCPNCREEWLTVSDVGYLKAFAATIVNMKNSDKAIKLLRLQIVGLVPHA